MVSDEHKWVIAFDKTTGERRDLVCCPKNNAPFYEEKFRMNEHEVRTLSDAEVDELIAMQKAAGREADLDMVRELLEREELERVNGLHGGRG